MGHAHDEKTRALAVRMYVKGEDYALIQARTGASRRTIQRWCEAAGVPRRKPSGPSVFSAKARAKAVRMYLAGERMSAIEAATGAADETIRRWVTEAGGERRASGWHGRYDTAEVVALAKAHGPNDAARRLGCSPGTVHYHVEKARREREGPSESGPRSGRPATVPARRSTRRSAHRQEPSTTPCPSRLRRERIRGVRRP